MTYFVERHLSPSVGYVIMFSVGMDPKNVRSFLAVLARQCKSGEIQADLDDLRLRRPALYSIPDRWFDGVNITDTYKSGQ